jgi:murein DD-endopeptidase MepM/ murein hydrolase activator NlpD
LEEGQTPGKHSMDITQALQSGLWTTGLLLSIIYPQSAATEIHDPEALNNTDQVTIQELSEKDAQSLKVSEDVAPATLDRGTYSATSAEEVAAIQAQREAEAKAKAEEEARIKASEAAKAKTQFAASAPAPKMNGNFAWPVTGYHVNWDINGYQTSSRPGHMGLDMMCPAMTPIYAAHEGTVIMSSESSSGWGVVVKVRSVIDGQEIVTTYAHMTYGTRQVERGATVQAGQLLGNVGMTGRASANHLHFEVEINGSHVDPASWLEKNLGPVG